MNKPTATDHLGPFLVANILLPLLQSISVASRDSDVRVINVSRTAIDLVPSGHSFSLLEAWNNDSGGECSPLRFLHRYGHSKVANVLCTTELQRQLDQESSRILVAAVQPGVVATPRSEKSLG
ncbi:uncharacterized protein CC84DRAFT_1105486 [Paraphaeosphaeria sporulosa]|uniref:NAD(P)-binding protein n=1 Tax=Paraphaeosphaeria sporulosa TaxID=1460663 RepID=A0A177BTT3_9PLEO|nr:uncharacterized protein CC84DRAFT_1105486 [Paraphaeosphaeria sporulosa]OAF98822.1 hypothetical protein CC84DRAFT_1105486 [Paraphaeosphaeria sporulosa]